MGISLYLVWKKGLQEKEIKIGLLIFGIQLSLNVLWSFLFFELRSPYYTFVEIIFLWIAILTTLTDNIEIQGNFKNNFLSTIALYPVG